MKITASATWPIDTGRTRTKNETTCTEETMHRIKSPGDNFLQVRCCLANKEVECPVRCRGQRDTFGTNCERKNLTAVSKHSHRFMVTTYLWRVKPWNGSPTITEERVIYNNASDHCSRRCWYVDVHEPSSRCESNTHLKSRQRRHQSAKEYKSKTHYNGA